MLDWALLVVWLCTISSTDSIPTDETAEEPEITELPSDISGQSRDIRDQSPDTTDQLLGTTELPPAQPTDIAELPNEPNEQPIEPIIELPTEPPELPSYHCIWHNNTCVDSCPEWMVEVKSDCRLTYGTAQRTCEHPELTLVGMICGAARCDCPDPTVLDTETGYCYDVDNCPTKHSIY